MLQRLLEIYSQLYEIEKRLIGSSIKDIKNVEQDMALLADDFYEVCKHMIAPQQHKAIRTDFSYFSVLLNMAVDYYTSIEEEKENRQ